MNVIIAPDSYKGCLDAANVAQTIGRAWKSVFPHANIQLLPMADGGEGTLDALIYSSNGVKIDTTATGPLMKRVHTSFGVMGDGVTVVIEIAQVCGLPMIEEHLRNPMSTTSYGVGEILLQAMDLGYRSFIIGLGGSATNDGGLGMLQALGGVFLDSSGCSVYPVGGSLKHICSVNLSNLDSRIKDCTFVVASDVTNPLCGLQGASFTFAPQKGATMEQIVELDDSINAYAQLMEIETGLQDMHTAGAGAAGGLGFAFLQLGARMQSGAQVVSEAVGLSNHIAEASWVITGEGRSDDQTLFGKLPIHVGKIAKEHQVKAILISGGLGDGYEQLYEYFVSCHSIALGPLSLQESMQNGEKLLYQSALNVALLVNGCLK